MNGSFTSRPLFCMFILVYIGCSMLNNLFLSYSSSDYEGGEEEEENEEEYDELDHRDEGQFWVTHDDGVEYAENEDWMEDSVQEKKAKPDPVISLFALGTLCRYKQTSLIIFQDYCSNGTLYKKFC